MKIPGKLLDGLTKIAAELAIFLDVAVTADEDNVVPGRDDGLATHGDPVWLCKTKRIEDDVQVGYAFPQRAVVQMGKTLLLIPYHGPDEDAEVNDEVLEAFKEVFNVFVGTWNRTVPEKSRMRNDFEADAVVSMSGEEFTEWLAGEAMQLQTLPMKVGDYEHCMALYGPSEWMGFEAEAGKSGPAKSGAVKSGDMDLGGDTSDAATGDADGGQAPASGSAGDAPDAAAADGSAVSGDSDGAEGDDEYEVVGAGDDDAEVIPHGVEVTAPSAVGGGGATPSHGDPAIAASAAAGAAAGGGGAVPQPARATSARLSGQPVVLVDESGALNNWLALQIERGRLKALKASGKPAAFPPGSSVVMLHADGQSIEGLNFEQMYVLQARRPSQ